MKNKSPKMGWNHCGTFVSIPIFHYNSKFFVGKRPASTELFLLLASELVVLTFIFFRKGFNHLAGESAAVHPLKTGTYLYGMQESNLELQDSQLRTLESSPERQLGGWIHFWYGIWLPWLARNLLSGELSS